MFETRWAREGPSTLQPVSWPKIFEREIVHFGFDCLLAVGDSPKVLPSNQISFDLATCKPSQAHKRGRRHKPWSAGSLTLSTSVFPNVFSPRAVTVVGLELRGYFRWLLS